MAEQEWKCPECERTGSYQEIRIPIDRGLIAARIVVLVLLI